MSEVLDPPYAPLPDDAVPCLRLWERQGTKGWFLGGKIGAARLHIYRNPHRRDDQDAEWLLTILPGGQPFAAPEPRRD